MSVDPVSIGIELAMVAASMAITASQKFEGQRLDTLDVNLADYGAPLPWFWGAQRFNGCPIIFAEKLKEKKQTNKTKGGKYVEYKYSGTWALAVADHEIDAVLGIWMDRHLCYQAKEAGPLVPVLGSPAVAQDGLESIPVKLGLNTNLRVYLGTEDQAPDPRYSTWCEGRYGPGTAPAFKGVAYLVFIDIPLEKFGNRLPQVSVEAVRTKTEIWPSEQVDTNIVDYAGQQYAVSGNGVYLMRRENTRIETWHLPTRTRMSSAEITGIAFLVAGAAASVDDLGSVWIMSSSVLYQATLGGGVNSFASGDGLSGSWPAMALTTRAGHMVFSGRTFGGYYLHEAPVEGPTIGITYCVDDEGYPWGLFTPAGVSDQFEMRNMLTNESHMFTSPVTRPHVAQGAGMCYSLRYGHFYLILDGHTLTIDKATFTLTDHGAALSTNAESLPFNRITGVTFWDYLSEYSLEDGSLIRTVSQSLWAPNEVGFSGTFYDPIGDALITGTNISSPHMDFLSLNRFGNGGVRLRDIVSEVLTKSNITSYDATALDQVIKGYSVVQGTGREMIEPLLTAHLSSCRPHDFGLEFIKLGGAALGPAIVTDDFAALDEGPSFSCQEAQDKDLPRKVTVNFSDSGKDYQNNNVIAQRGLDEVASVADKTIDMTTYVGTPDEMRPLADRYFRQLWLERESTFNALPPQHLDLEAGDVRILSLKGKLRTVRAESVKFTAGGLKIEWKRTHASVVTLSNNPGAPMDGHDPDEVPVLGPTKAIILDVPLISDAEDSSVPQLHYGAGKYSSSAAWPGAALYKGDAGGANYVAWNDVPSSGAMTWGSAKTALGEVASPWAWDRGNSVNVEVHGDSLSSVTEAEIDADPSLNLGVLYNATTGKAELFNYATAFLEADGTYTLSDFKRGRRGTEGACGVHEIGDTFVLAADLLRASVGLSEDGTTEYFKAATLGGDPDSSPVISLPFEAATLMPRAPARFRAWRDIVSGDWHFEWTRRTRVGGRWVGGTTIPLAENSEAYELAIPTATGARTVGITTGSATWTSAEQADDYGAPQAGLPDGIAVYQLSDAVGRGFPASDPQVFLRAA